MSVTSTDKIYKALFEAQRRCNLLKILQTTGYIDFTLSANHRAHGDVHDCARGALYVSDMKMVNGKNDEPGIDRGMKGELTAIPLSSSTRSPYPNFRAFYHWSPQSTPNYSAAPWHTTYLTTHKTKITKLKIAKSNIAMLSLPDDDAFLGDDIIDLQLSSEMSIGAGLDEIRAFFPSDAPAASEPPETESEAEELPEVIPATQPGAEEPDELAGS
ncbi:hypothetical protein HDV62DRAFT_401432 [Trichoderma sp. SZMC 28011]